MSQPEFGKAVGVSGKTIQQIENGLLKISPGLAQKISQIFLLDPDQLVKGCDPEHPRFIGRGIPFPRVEIHFFTREGYELRKKAARDLHRAEVDKDLANLNFALEVFVDAANHSKCYGPFLTAYMKMLTSLGREFGLLERTNRILTDYTARPDGDLDTDLFCGLLLPGMRENRARIRPWLYDELPDKNKPSVSRITRNAPIEIQFMNAPFLTTGKQSLPRSSPKGKSPRKPAPHPPPRDRGSAAQKPSSSRRARAAG